ncbi:MAG: hypothetical protein EBX36_08000 [Planctomycetia bacterium]|nr:hypothetical protein [Planctomycetia bacterium]
MYPSRQNAWSRGKCGGNVTHGLCFHCSCWKGWAWNTFDPRQQAAGAPHRPPCTLPCQGGCCQPWPDCPPRQPQSPAGPAAGSAGPAISGPAETSTGIPSPIGSPICTARAGGEDAPTAQTTAANSSERTVGTKQAPR